MAHSRVLTEQQRIKALKIARNLNRSDVGTHYSSRAELASHERALRGEPR